MHLCKCVPGRTKTGAVLWRCSKGKNKALCDQHNSGNQISYRIVLLGWLNVYTELYYNFLFPRSKCNASNQSYLSSLKFWGKCQSRGIHPKNPSPFLFTTSFTPRILTPNRGSHVWKHHSVPKLKTWENWQVSDSRLAFPCWSVSTKFART